jgi:hypothetical protein
MTQPIFPPGNDPANVKDPNPPQREPGTDFVTPPVRGVSGGEEGPGEDVIAPPTESAEGKDTLFGADPAENPTFRPA